MCPILRLSILRLSIFYFNHFSISVLEIDHFTFDAFYGSTILQFGHFNLQPLYDSTMCRWFHWSPLLGNQWDVFMWHENQWLAEIPTNLTAKSLEKNSHWNFFKFSVIVSGYDIDFFSDFCRSVRIWHQHFFLVIAVVSGYCHFPLIFVVMSENWLKNKNMY